MAYEATSQSIFQAYLKNMWHRGRVVDMTMRDKPLLAMINKATDFLGEDQKVTVKYVNPMGRSANSSKAQSNARSGRAVRFSVTRVSNHQSVFVSNETLEASANDMGALVSAVDDQMEGAVENLVREIAFGLYRDGGGTRGRLNGTPTDAGGGADAYITLRNPRHAKDFFKGQVLKCGTTDGTTATTFRSTPSTAEVKSVDRKNGIIYFAGGTFAGTNWADGDYLSVDGDIDETSLVGKYIKGLAAWGPYTISASDSFFGINRSLDPTALGFWQYDGRQKSIENALIYAAGEVQDNGGSPDVCFLSSRTWTNLAVSLGTRVQYVDMFGTQEAANISFKAFVLPTNKGVLRVVGDPFCQDEDAWLLQMNTLKWHTLGEAPKPNLKSGLDMLDPSTATDDVEMRWVYRGNLECNAPGYNCRVRLA